MLRLLIVSVAVVLIGRIALRSWTDSHLN